MSNVIQKVVRLKITTPVHPTNSWKEFREMDREVDLKIVKVQLNERKAKEKRPE